MLAVLILVVPTTILIILVTDEFHKVLQCTRKLLQCEAETYFH